MALHSVTLPQPRGVPRGESVVWAIGDSITAQGYVAASGSSTSYDTATSWLRWASMLSANAIRFGGIAATGGFTSAQVLATHLPTVLAQIPQPDYCFVLCGTNDVPIGSATTLANLTSIYTQLQAAGITPVLCTLTPRNDYVGSTADTIVKLNIWITRTARLNNWPCIDFYGALAATGGGYITGYNQDNVHPSGTGARVMGQAIANKLATVMQPVDGLLPSTNRWPSLHNSGNCLNLTDSNADGIPDGWTLVGGTATNTITAMTATEGIGNWWNITNTTTASGTILYRSTTGFTLVPGNKCAFICRVKTANMVSSGSGFRIRPTTNNFDNYMGAFFVASNISADVTAASTFASEFIVPSGLSTTTGLLGLFIDGGTGTLSVGQIAWIDLTAAGIA